MNIFDILERAYKVSDVLLANRARLERDCPELINFANDLLPVIQKHWPLVGPRINDMLPILAEIGKDMK